MRYLTTGDFVFPFNLKAYLTEQLYLWSYNSGVPNLDEIIRFFIRIPNVIVYSLTGSNLVVSYFYIGLVALVCFFSFKYFCNTFIGIHDRVTVFALSLLYTINPIFLGNYAKIGLVLAVTMAPLLLTYIKLFFIREKFKYLLLIILALNVSFIHPFCLTVNFVLTAGYFLILARKDTQVIKANLPKLFSAGIIFVLLNLYIILSVLALGSIDKSLLSQNLSDVDLNSANLISIANTGNMLTAFSFSKNVFLDFQFYNDWYDFFYFAGMFILLALLIGLFIYSYYRLTKQFKKYLLATISIFLLLMLFTTGTFMGIDRLMSMLLALPGGWAFRSPLKWQLYMPLFFGAALILLFDTVRGRLRQYTLGVLALAFVLINSFIGYDVFRKLFVPNTALAFSNETVAPGEKRALLIKDEHCEQYFLEDFTLLSNIRESYAAQSIQLKEVNQEDAHRIHLATYSEVVTCSDQAELSLYGFSKTTEVQTSDGKNIFVFQNPEQRGKVYLTQLFGVEKDSGNRGAKHHMVEQTPATTDFVDNDVELDKQGNIIELFENISADSISEGVLRQAIPPGDLAENHTLQVTEPVFYSYDPAHRELKLFSQQQPDTEAVNSELPLPPEFVAMGGTVSYNDSQYAFNNLAYNGSLEDGLWQKTVGDCFNFDNNPMIGMGLSDDRTDGTRSIKLDAERHIACTGPEEVPISGDETYLIYFDYKTNGQTGSRYNLLVKGFDIAASTGNLPATGGEWKSFSRMVAVPRDMSTMKVTLYGVPSIKSGRTETWFDNVRVVKVPRIASKYFITGSRQQQSGTGVLDYISENPTRTRVSLARARGVVTVVLNDSYHDGWRLVNSLQSSILGGVHGIPVKHFAVNGYENGWQLDVGSYCQDNAACTVNEDGTYNLTFTVEFTPQRWLVVGLVISSGVLAGITLYLIGVHVRDKKNPLPDRKLVYHAR